MVRLPTSLLFALLAISTMFGAGHGVKPDDHTSSGAGSDAAEAAAVEAIDLRSRTASPAGPLPFFYDLYSFRGDSGRTAVVASFAVRAGKLDREQVEGRVRYRFSVTLVLADTARRIVSRADDTVFVAVSGPLAQEHLLHAFIETRAQPSSTTVQRVVMIDAPNPGTGQLYSYAFEIPDYSGDHLMLSDVALGLPGRKGGWKRGDVTLALLPSLYFPGGVFDVYYEIYNLPNGNPYNTEIAFEPVDEAGAPRAGSERPIRVRFAGESSAGLDGVLRELRRVEVPLSTGYYRLTVTVTDEERGVSTHRSRLLQVREWSEDATLVPTCPVKPGVNRPGCRSR